MVPFTESPELRVPITPALLACKWKTLRKVHACAWD
jgi:hypothetical protein